VRAADGGCEGGAVEEAEERERDDGRREEGRERAAAEHATPSCSPSLLRRRRRLHRRSRSRRAAWRLAFLLHWLAAAGRSRGAACVGVGWGSRTRTRNGKTRPGAVAGAVGRKQKSDGLVGCGTVRAGWQVPGSAAAGREAGGGRDENGRKILVASRFEYCFLSIIFELFAN
jgi:hypothetical protein